MLKSFHRRACIAHEFKFPTDIRHEEIVKSGNDQRYNTRLRNRRARKNRYVALYYMLISSLFFPPYCPSKMFAEMKDK